MREPYYVFETSRFLKSYLILTSAHISSLIWYLRINNQKQIMSLCHRLFFKSFLDRFYLSDFRKLGTFVWSALCIVIYHAQQHARYVTYNQQYQKGIWLKIIWRQKQYLINLGRVKLEKQNIQVIQGDNETITISVASTTSHEAILTGNLTRITHYHSPGYPIDIKVQKTSFRIL